MEKPNVTKCQGMPGEDKEQVKRFFYTYYKYKITIQSVYVAVTFLNGKHFNAFYLCGFVFPSRILI